MSTAISKCEVSGARVTLTWGEASSSVDFSVNVLNIGTYNPS